MQKKPKKLPPHSFLPMGRLKRIVYMYCSDCGLIRLKNEATTRAINRGCEGEKEDPA